MGPFQELLHLSTKGPPCTFVTANSLESTALLDSGELTANILELAMAIKAHHSELQHTTVT